MKKLVLMLLFLLGITYTSNAQKIPTPDEVAKKNVEELEKRLKLTPTQKSVIYNFSYEFSKEQFALYKKQQAGLFKEEDETKFFKMQTELNRNIKTVLKGDQIGEFDKLIEERLSGVDPTKKKKKLKKGEEEEKVVGIEGLKTKPTNN
jgi:protein CpxP